MFSGILTEVEEEIQVVISFQNENRYLWPRHLFHLFSKAYFLFRLRFTTLSLPRHFRGISVLLHFWSRRPVQIYTGEIQVVFIEKNSDRD